ncbi:ribosomal protein L15 [Elsinoe australis]|uniref:Ribosomal protein L15 n=1 Tax=Elsinoe australis TaxID=40998 RepID=A0A2P7YW89_9PEZI|nr:ribosomal protein L15 [Elsinoe australis]
MGGKDAEWSSSSDAAYTLEQVTSDHAYKDWLVVENPLEESLRDPLYTSINKFTNIKTNANIERGLNRTTAAAIALSLRLHFHPATFRFTPYYFDMKEKDESKI